MKINPINFNFIQNKQNNRTLPQSSKLSGLKADTYTFTGVADAEDVARLNRLVPKHKGVVYKKVLDSKGEVIDKIPLEVDIKNCGEGTFHFDIDKKTIGGVVLKYIPRNKCKDTDNDICSRFYPEEGFWGDRVAVDYLYNVNELQYGGIGHLADLLEVAVCNELGFKPSVISKSMEHAGPIHYKRGKRFIPFEKYDDQMKHFYNKDPNEIIKAIVENTPKGEYFDTSCIYHYFLTYMPDDMVEKLEDELSEHPIF